MNFRYARHTNSLQPLIKFYTEIIGLKILGDFENHNYYDGVFLGFVGENWHLEFTVSDDSASHEPDEDDLLVFYVDSQAEMNAIINRAVASSIKIAEPKNPYWKTNGVNLLDPDGFGVIISVRK